MLYCSACTGIKACSQWWLLASYPLGHPELDQCTCSAESGYWQTISEVVFECCTTLALATFPYHNKNSGSTLTTVLWSLRCMYWLCNALNFRYWSICQVLLLSTVFVHFHVFLYESSFMYDRSTDKRVFQNTSFPWRMYCNFSCC